MADSLEEKFNEKWAKLVISRVLDIERGEGKELQAFRQSKTEKYISDAEMKIDKSCQILIKKMEVYIYINKYILDII